MVHNKVVAHFKGGELLKGTTGNFNPARPLFHIRLRDTGGMVEVDVRTLKGLFFVKDFEGNPEYNDRVDVERHAMGRRIQVRFEDTETIVGYTHSLSQSGTGFFMAPADPESNNERIFVLRDATVEIHLV